jgi:ribosomal protein L17
MSTKEEKTITDLTQKQQSVTAASAATSLGLSGTIQTEQKKAKRPRGIKAYNLIITSLKNNDKDPKQQDEDIFCHLCSQKTIDQWSSGHEHKREPKYF